MAGVRKVMGYVAVGENSRLAGSALLENCMMMMGPLGGKTVV